MRRNTTFNKNEIDFYYCVKITLDNIQHKLRFIFFSAFLCEACNTHENLNIEH